MKHNPTRLGLFALSFVLSGCDAGACEESSRTAVSDPYANLAIGDTYASALATIARERTGPLLWLDNDRLETEITITIHAPATAWDVDAEQQDDHSETCTDRLDAEVEVELRTEDGILDANLVVPVTFTTPDSLTVAVDVTDEQLGAWLFTVDPATSLVLALFYSATEATGSLQLRNNDDSGRNPVDIATWVAR